MEYKDIVKSLYQELEKNFTNIKPPKQNYIQFPISSKFGTHFELWLIDKDEKMYLDFHQENSVDEINEALFEFLAEIIVKYNRENEYEIIERERSKNKILRQKKYYEKDDILNSVNEIIADVQKIQKIFTNEIEDYLNTFKKIDLSIISNENIISALKEFDLDKEMCKGREAVNWQLVYNNRIYPHKCIVGRAYKIAKNEDGILNSYLYGSICNQNYCASKILKELGFELKNIKQEQNKENSEMSEYKINQSLNQILYGPPGTGKTYNTINKAIEIIDKDFYELHKEETDENRKLLKEKFDEYKRSGQIEFVTFHQSYGYEEFVEGIKAIPSGEEGNEKDEMIYKVVPGIFRRISKKAEKNQREPNLINSGFSEKLNTLKENIQIALLENGEFQLTDSVYIFDIDEDAFRYKGKWNHNQRMKFSDLEKLYVDEITTRQDIVNNNSISGLARQHATYFNKIMEKLFEINIEKNKSINEVEDNPKKNYILIIDEINRGNISKIFGELITLIEDTKRLGKDEQVEITLPYSGEKFGVPKNLYILGTMNTADRSIALMDTALRRRFEFIEMMPKTELLDENEIDEINIKLLLETINKRIEYLYDRDHTIGHAYFMSLKGIEKEEDKKAELDNIFRNKIIPLLQEYFYDDWEKIQIVLGDHFAQLNNIINYNGEDCKSFEDEQNKFRFIQSQKITEKSIIGFNHDDIEDESIDYRINPNKGGFPKEAYIKIYSDYSKINTNNIE